MTPEDLALFREEIVQRHERFNHRINQLAFASAEEESLEHDADALAESLFLRYFATYETDIERLFLHYVTGGISLSGRPARSYLQVTEEPRARKIVRAGFKFLSWAKASNVKETATTYLENGWPLTDMLATRTQDLADCEKIRNRIAHHSLEASQEFAAVQRNLFFTERLFPISAGQLLRVRHRTKKKSHIAYYGEVINSMLIAVIDPPQ